MLKIAHKWVWDFWFAQDGPDYHVFYLQAPRELGDENLRHWHAVIGHAVSTDLTHWQILPDAFCPSEGAAWDDYLTWTGSITKSAGTWYFYYTGGCRSEYGKVQRIGLATSRDLLNWIRYPGNPLIRCNPTWYESLDLSVWHEEAWRDPWVFQHPHTGDWHVFITARLNHGAPDGRGCIAHARSKDLFHWEVLPPVTALGDFGHMEVPQLIEIQGKYYLLFSVSKEVLSENFHRRTGITALTGTHYLVSENPLGPFHYAGDKFLLGDASGSYYSAKIISDPAGKFVCLACRHYSSNGSYLGEISDPMPLNVGQAGELKIIDENV